MQIRRESGVPASPPFIGINELVFNEATGEFLAKLDDGRTVALNYPPADVPVGSGEARGADAVDFQRTRNAPDQVAAGARSMLLGGKSNRATFLRCEKRG